MMRLHDGARRPRECCSAAGGRRGGFTLLEIMIALALVAVLFSLMGTAIDLYLRAAQRGRAAVESAVLARNVLDRMTRELQSALAVRVDDGRASSESGDGEASRGSQDRDGADQPTADEGESSTAADDTLAVEEPLSEGSAPAVAGLRGSREAVQFDIAWLPGPETWADTLPSSDQGGASRPAAIETIQYAVRSVPAGHAVDAVGAGEPEDGPRTGLVGRQWDRIALLSSGELGSDVVRTADLRMFAPEVRAIEFRYWDGLRWQGTWDPASAGRPLPAAVEVAILVAAAPHNAPSPLPGETGGSLFDRRSDTAIGTIYRRLIDLPTAGQEAAVDTQAEEAQP